jgi:ubiquinone/menaquinone biosynthesis C-methylase UbiE
MLTESVMPGVNMNDLPAILLDDLTFRTVESSIYSVLPDNESGNEYDTRFGSIYDMVACNPMYNRLIWGYSIKIFSQITGQALNSSQTGYVLDVGCGSLAFTAKIYSQYTERPVVLVDRSIKMLRLAKARLLSQSGHIPENINFLHADALQLPFKENAFTTIISENLLHCLDDTGILLKQLKNMMSKNGHMYFTTLVRSNRLADKYINTLANNGKLVSRSANDHKKIFDQAGFSIDCQTVGNILVIKGSNSSNQDVPSFL